MCILLAVVIVKMYQKSNNTNLYYTNTKNIKFVDIAYSVGKVQHVPIMIKYKLKSLMHCKKRSKL